MERDILVEVNHPFIVKLHYGKKQERKSSDIYMLMYVGQCTNQNRRTTIICVACVALLSCFKCPQTLAPFMLMFCCWIFFVTSRLTLLNGAMPA